MGVLLYEMLAGRVPFDADTDFTLQKLHVEAPPPPLRDLNPAVPEWLESVVLRCLAKSPDDRFAGCASAAAVLHRGASKAAAPPPRVLKMDASTQPPSPEPGNRDAQGPPIDPPSFLRPQTAPASRSKRGLALTGFAFVAIALALGWWLAQPKPKDVVRAGVPVQAAPPKPAPVATPPVVTPPDRELTRMRDAVVRAVRAKNWPKAGSLIDNLLAQYPTDAQALEWRYLLQYSRKSDLFAKLNPKGGTPGAQDLAGAEQLLQQGEYAAAIATFQHVLAGDPGNARAQDGLKRATDAKAAEDRIWGGGR